MDFIIEIDTASTPSLVQVCHATKNYQLLKLVGVESSLFLKSGVLPAQYCKTGLYQCSKKIAWHLILASVAVKESKHKGLLSSEGFYLNISQRLSNTFCHANITRLPYNVKSSLQKWLLQSSSQLSFEEYAIAAALFELKGRHLCESDIEVLMLLKPLNISPDAIAHALHTLVDSGLIQVIQVTDAIRFYDVNTQPHAHIYCEQTNQLFDAEVEGCIRLKNGSGIDRIALANEASHSLSVRVSVN
ncbi:MAG: transcriptional repressor [Gammaproteobacteria bacterium]